MEIEAVVPLSFNISIDTPPAVNVNLAAGRQAAVIITQGPRGPTGPAGPSFTGTAWWYGQGPPNVLVGSKIGDFYMDTVTGTVYELEVGG